MDDADNELIQALQRYRRSYEQHERSVPDQDVNAARKTVAKALHVVKSSGLAAALIDVMDATRRWHAWSKRPDFSKFLSFAAEEVVASCEMKGAFPEKVRSAFTYKEHRYGIGFHDEGWSNYGEAFHHGKVEFYDVEELVLGLDIADNMNPDYSQWHEFNIYAFRGGEWMSHLLEMAVDIRNHNSKALTTHQDADALRRAAGIKF